MPVYFSKLNQGFSGSCGLPPTRHPRGSLLGFPFFLILRGGGTSAALATSFACAAWASSLAISLGALRLGNDGDVGPLKMNTAWLSLLLLPTIRV